VPACSLFIAPWLTLVCRSALAAVVFTIAIPGFLVMASDIVGAIIYGTQNAAAIDRLKVVVFWPGMLTVCVAAAVAGWRLFSRLEILGDLGGDIHFPDAFSAREAREPRTRVHRHPFWLLTIKELRLQQLAFAVAGLYVPSALVLAWLDPAPAGTETVVLPASFAYGWLLALLIGSVASAEERRLGTLEWQLLMPTRFLKQWAVKALVAFGLQLTLGVMLPAALIYLLDAHIATRQHQMVVVLALFSYVLAMSLYVSTLVRSPMAALVVSLVIAAASWPGAITLVGQARWFYYRRGGTVLPVHDLLGWALVAAICGMVALLLYLGARNHRAADRPLARVAWQALVIVGYFTLSLVGLALLGLR
jgi:hypothetical protein